MPRFKRQRRINFSPNITYFKPQGIPMQNLEQIELGKDEVESIKLADYDNLQQSDAAEKMGISQPTFARIHISAIKKISEALIEGKAIKFVD